MRSVRARVTLAATVIVLLVLAGTGAALVAAQSAVLTDNVDEVLTRNAQTIADELDAVTRSGSIPGMGDEVVRGGGYGAGSDVAFMLDQCHNIEDKIPGQIRSVLNVQEMTARALLVDTAALGKAQAAGDVLAANGILMDAFYTDVRPDLAAWRESRGLPADPMAAYAASGYGASIVTGRVGGNQAGWGA